MFSIRAQSLEPHQLLVPVDFVDHFDVFWGESRISAGPGSIKRYIHMCLTDPFSIMSDNEKKEYSSSFHTYLQRDLRRGVICQISLQFLASQIGHICGTGGCYISG